MSVRINLLPYRQMQRAESQRRFTLLSVMAAIAGLLVVFVGYTYLSQKLEYQNSRNQRLQGAIAKLDSKIREITALKDKISTLKERISAVEKLQKSRSVVVVMLDELSRKIPEAVVINSLKQNGEKVVLNGVADTNTRVASLINNLNSSNVFVAPQLIQINSKQQSENRESVFILNVKLKALMPEPESDE